MHFMLNGTGTICDDRSGTDPYCLFAGLWRQAIMTKGCATWRTYIEAEQAVSLDRVAMPEDRFSVWCGK
jgi:hypothetical protein